MNILQNCFILLRNEQLILQQNQIKSSDLRMLDEEDQFYKELPFTLTADQAKPNYVIFGTGLQQCLLAAHFSKIHLKPGLILDIDKTYGSCLKTVTIKELHALSAKKAKINLYEFLDLPQFEEENLAFYNKLLEDKAYRGYNIDLQPNFFFGSSITCQMLKEADMDKYMDFRIVYNMLHYDGKGFKNVPLSKGKIFQSKDLGLLQKKLLLNTFHSLSQIYNKFMNVEQDQNSTKEFDKQFGQVDQKLYTQFLAEKDNSFVGFLSKMTKNNQKIMNYIIYILCNYQYNYKRQLPNHAKNDYTLGQFIRRFGKFVKSCGIYGEGPYLYVDNGIGDVPQAYSRIASIYLSTYILHPKIEINKIQVAEDNVKIYTNLYPEGFIETKQVYYGPTCYHLKFIDKTEYEQEYTLRVIFLCQKQGTQEDCPSIVYLVDVKQCQNPVYLFMLDGTSHTCPENLIVYQFQTVIESKQMDKCVAKVNSFLEILTSTRGQNFNSQIKYVSAYIREKRYPKGQNIVATGTHETILRDHTGIDLDSHFINFKSVVGEQPTYFRKEGSNPNEQPEGEWSHQDQTTGLIEKLQAIDIHKEPNDAEQAQLQQENHGNDINYEGHEKNKGKENQDEAEQIQEKVEQTQNTQQFKQSQPSKAEPSPEQGKQQQLNQEKVEGKLQKQDKEEQKKNHKDQNVVISNQPAQGYLTHIQ